MKPSKYWYNPGFKIPRIRIPRECLEELHSFTNSESTDFLARVEELAFYYEISVDDILRELNL